MVNEDDADSASGSAGAVAAKLVKAAIEGRPPMARGFVKRKSRTKSLQTKSPVSGKRKFQAQRPNRETAPETLPAARRGFRHASKPANCGLCVMGQQQTLVRRPHRRGQNATCMARPSLTGHCGHGWTCSLPRPVAIDHEADPTSTWWRSNFLFSH